MHEEKQYKALKFWSDFQKISAMDEGAFWMNPRLAHSEYGMPAYRQIMSAIHLPTYTWISLHRIELCQQKKSLHDEIFFANTAFLILSSSLISLLILLHMPFHYYLFW